MSKITVIGCLTYLLFSFINSHAQTIYQGAEAESIIIGAEKIILNKKNDAPTFVVMNNSSFIKESDHLPWLISNVLKLNADYQLVLYKTERDELGFTHYRYKELYKGKNVEHGVYYVHAKNGKVISVNGEFYAGISKNLLSATPKINKNSALLKAKSLFLSKELNDYSDKHEDITILQKNNVYYLCYHFEISSNKPLKRTEIYVDAQTNKVILEINKIHTTDVPGTLATQFNGTKTTTIDQINGSQYRLQQATKNIYTKNCNYGSNQASTVDFINASVNWTAATPENKAVFDLYYGLEKSYDYYNSKFLRNSYDGIGTQIKGVAHYDVGFNNAFWDGTYMVFGDGDGSTYLPFSSTDIVGHELTHAVTESSAGLIYMDESGGLNESFSDIFGVAIDFYANPTTANFLEGEQCSITNTPFRDMTNPKSGFQPDTYFGQYWIPAGGIDNGGVHTNSQVQNHWFYLLCQGGSGTNDNALSFTISGIGINNAEKIAYRNLTTYLTPNSDYNDARTYAIQSAIDLFGSCSNNVTQCANAWYAVGIGSGFYNNSVVSQFSSNNNYSCTIPATISFTNNSLNSNTYFWDFGDGGTSTLANPTHIYTAAGNYSIKLKSIGTSSCNTADSITKLNFVSITTVGLPITACTPAQGNSSSTYGITKVEFAAISKTSSNASEGYKDFMCTNQATLVAGNPYLVRITTQTAQERICVWIDYNNDGALNSTNELIFSSLNPLNSITTHTMVVQTPTNAALGVPLRLRVSDDYNTITGSCASHSYGQTEDYTVRFSATTAKPIVNFYSNNRITTTNTLVNFFDSTLNAPTIYRWEFQGASTLSSNLKNPSVMYPSVGTFSVKLVATNGFGSDSTTKISYVTVVNVYNICAGTNSTSATTGTLYDSGGPTGYYQDYENCQFLINPGCTGTITVNFTQFGTENCCDVMRVYNGTNTAAPLLGTYQGTALPPNLYAASGKMLITWTSDGSGTDVGFAANWSSVLSGTIAPVANFSVSSTTPPLNTAVQFTDQTSNMPYQWQWQFGDGTISALQNPTKTYTVSGIRTITLSATNCNTTSITTKTVNVQAAPNLTVNPTSLGGITNCGDSLIIPVTLTNNGPGTLVYNSSINGNDDSVKVLICTYGVDMTAGGDYTKTRNAISSYYTKYSVTQYVGNTAAGLQTAMANKDVILFPRQYTNTDTHYSSYVSTLNTYVTNGGTVIFCGSNGSIATTRPFTTGLFNGSYNSTLSNYSSTVTLPNDSLLFGIGVTTFNGNLNYMSFTDVTKVTPVILTGYTYDVVSYKNIGAGKAIFIGSDFFTINANFSYILARAIKKAKTTTSSISYLSPTSGTLSAAVTQTANVIISTIGKPAGVYTATLSITGNNPVSPYLVPVTYTVNGAATPSISATCINFGSMVQYTVKRDSVILYNLGCSTLSITAMSVSNAAYTFTPSTTYSIAAWSNKKIQIKLSPVTSGSFIDTMRIVSNAGTMKICLNASVTPAPVITVTPTSLTATLTSCNDSITKILKIKNIGTANLTFSVSSLSVSTATNDFLIIDHNKNGRNNFNPHTTQLVAETTFSTLNLAQLKNHKVVYFEPDWGNYSNLTNNMANLTSYVNQGGVVVINIAGNIGNGINIDPYGTDFLATSTHSAAIINAASNPYITGAGYSGYTLTPADFNNWNSTDHGTLTGYPAGSVVLSNTNGVSFIQYPMGNGYVILNTLTFGWVPATGSTLKAQENLINYAYFLSQSSQRPNWISISDTLGTIPLSDSLVTSVKFKSTGLVNGTYTYSMVIKSNDPVNPIVTVPCTLVVNGTPNIALSKSCFNFTNTVSYNSRKDSVMISNMGCDTLRITNVVSTNSVFIPAATTIKIAPATSKYLKVTFTPTAAVTFSGTLNITNNAVGTTTMCLTGTGMPAPSISVTPASLSATLSACSSTQTLNLNVGNTGGSNLTYSLSGSSGTSMVNILVIMNFVSPTNYTNILYALNANSVNYSVTQHMLTNVASLQNALIGKTIVIFPQPFNGGSSYNTGFYQSYSVTINNFVNGGGTALMSGFYSTDMVNDLGMYYSTYAGSTSSNTNLNVIDTNDVIMRGVPFGNINSTGYNYYHTFTNTGTSNYITYGGTYPIVSKKNIGSGRAIYMAFDYSLNYNTIFNRIIANAVKSSISTAPWLSGPVVSTTVTPAATSIITLTVNSGNYAAGTYTYNLLINSNDPIVPTFSVPITMVVRDNPCADFSFTNANNCSGIVTFTNSTINTVTSYNWNFGNGTTSTLQNPTITYAASGIYSVVLTACNGTVCSTSTKTLVIGGVGGPVVNSCVPYSYMSGYNYGIVNVNINTINKSSGFADPEGYQDFSCSNQTNLTVGNNYLLTITTSPSYYENASVWIDFDNNGSFSAAEQILNSVNKLGSHTLNFTPPVSAVYNTPLRMRVIDEYYGYNITSACYNSNYGQAEDYTIKIQPNNVPPVALYTIQTNSCQGTVVFTDNSYNNPTSWIWNFGDGSASSIQNPTHTYTVAGTYTVLLVASNAFGSNYNSQVLTINPLVFTIGINGLMTINQPLTYTTSLNGGLSYTWDFGDGLLSALQNATHTYTTSGSYIVKLTIISGGCVNTMSTTIAIPGNVGINTNDAKEFGMQVFPNPFNFQTSIKLNLYENAELTMDIFNSLGQKTQNISDKKTYEKGIHEFSTDYLAKGIYFLRAVYNEKVYIFKLVSIE